VPVRPPTKLSQFIIVEAVRAFLDLAPTATLEDFVRTRPYSERTVQRALHAHGTSFRDERSARQLDRAASVLIEQGGRGQHVALLNAGRAAGDRRARHLCAPFKERYGTTPGKVWKIGCAVRELRAIAAAPPIHSRHDPAAYARRRRRIVRRRTQLRLALRELVPGTLVANAAVDALNATRASRGRRPSRSRRAYRRPRRQPSAWRSRP
jgi:AraC-like DNA-binding protein